MTSHLIPATLLFFFTVDPYVKVAHPLSKQATALCTERYTGWWTPANVNWTEDENGQQAVPESGRSGGGERSYAA